MYPPVPQGFGAGTDGLVYNQGVIEDWFAGVGTTKVTSFMKVQLEYCVVKVGCYTSARPSMKLWVTGSGGKKVKARTNGD